MEVNKQIIFDMENKAAQPQQQNPKPISKDSNLGVRLSMKKITKSPVPESVLPVLNPNQPVQIKGAIFDAQPVIQDVKSKPVDDFNPAIKHPASAPRLSINDIPAVNLAKQTKFKPEITHPASLPGQPRPVIPAAGKPKLGNYKARLAEKIKHNKTTKRNTTNIPKRNITHPKISIKAPSKKGKNLIFS